MHLYNFFFISYKICRPKKFAALGPGLTGLGVNTALGSGPQFKPNAGSVISTKNFLPLHFNQSDVLKRHRMPESK